ncbi:MAG: hypothetical protein VKL59_02800 [Nostocaceae cyanobacterium]|nr:hypothetical protein [Nostocaceae cyanobacterium]
MAHVVVLGGGIGGLPTAYELRRLLPRHHRITFFEKFFLTKMRWGMSVPWFERWSLRVLGFSLVEPITVASVEDLQLSRKTSQPSLEK